MKVSKLMKKIVTIMTVFSLVLGVSGILGNTIEVKASTSPVSLYYYDHVMSKYGIHQYVVAVRVNSNAQNKAVYIHYNNAETWDDAAASYVTTLSDGSEIWEATVTGLGVEYAIKFVGDGQTYWDNNNGNNYSGYDILGDANLKVKRRSIASDYTSFNVKVNVKNLAYTKVVKVRYTEDNWATYQDVELTYSSSDANTNTEIWETTLSLDESKKDSFQYCVYYNVNGQTYWDNNLGRNYTSSYVAPII